MKRRRRTLPAETLVEIKEHEYNAFTVDSVVDCNSIYPKSIDELVEKLKAGKLKFKTEISVEIVDKLRSGVLASPLVDEEMKELLIKSFVPSNSTLI